MEKQFLTQVPFQYFILKLASRCNLDCIYCYEYKLSDQSWRFQPHFMEPHIARQAAKRIAEHASLHNLDTIHLSLHGGEPLLLGPERFESELQIFYNIIGKVAKVTSSVQTNAVLVDQNWTDIFRRYNVMVNVSLDGPPEINDRRRPDHRGVPSHFATSRGIELIRRECPDQFQGIFAVIDIEADPIEVVDHLMTFQPTDIDLLIPDANWQLQPKRPNNYTGKDYGEWLTKVFDAWYFERRWGSVSIRTFEELLKSLLGGQGRLDTFGLVSSGIIVIGADGSILALDTLKSAYEGAVNLDLNVFVNSFQQALNHPTIKACQNRLHSMCEICKACSWAQVCGGGYYPHRYSGVEGGFDNPSVYCEDIKMLLGYMRDRIFSEIEKIEAFNIGKYQEYPNV